MVCVVVVRLSVFIWCLKTLGFPRMVGGGVICAFDTVGFSSFQCATLILDHVLPLLARCLVVILRIVFMNLLRRRW